VKREGEKRAGRVGGYIKGAEEKASTENAVETINTSEVKMK